MAKRILCILSSLDCGGAETFMMKLYRNFDREKYQMDFCVNADGVYDEEVLALGGKIHNIPLRTQHPLKSLFVLRQVVKKNRYKAVLKLGNAPLAVVDLIAAKLGGARVLAMRSCNALVNRTVAQKFVDKIFRFILNRVADVKFAPSDLAANYTFGRSEVKRGGVTILNNAVDLSVYHYDEILREEIRKEFALGDSLVIGHIGRFSKQKNHKFLVNVFAELKKKCPDAKLLLVGKGELYNTVFAQIEEYDLAEDVIFAGTRSDIPAILSAMDVFILPSFYEGMPNTVIEAQSTGLPCVITDTITQMANITGLVTYLSLSDTVEKWADTVVVAVQKGRKDTKTDFCRAGYDIDSAGKLFLEKMVSRF